jgi:hypothetical protein
MFREAAPRMPQSIRPLVAAAVDSADNCADDDAADKEGYREIAVAAWGAARTSACAIPSETMVTATMVETTSAMLAISDSAVR